MSHSVVTPVVAIAGFRLAGRELQRACGPSLPNLEVALSNPVEVALSNPEEVAPSNPVEEAPSNPAGHCRAGLLLRSQPLSIAD